VERVHIFRGTAGDGCFEQGNETSNSINMRNFLAPGKPSDVLQLI